MAQRVDMLRMLTLLRSYRWYRCLFYGRRGRIPRKQKSKPPRSILVNGELYEYREIDPAKVKDPRTAEIIGEHFVTLMDRGETAPLLIVVNKAHAKYLEAQERGELDAVINEAILRLLKQYEEE